MLGYFRSRLSALDFRIFEYASQIFALLFAYGKLRLLCQRAFSMRLCLLFTLSGPPAEL
jgi:hypothetical protein